MMARMFLNFSVEDHVSPVAEMIVHLQHIGVELPPLPLNMTTTVTRSGPSATICTVLPSPELLEYLKKVIDLAASI